MFFPQNQCAGFLADLHFLVAPDSLLDLSDKHLGAHSNSPQFHCDASSGLSSFKPSGRLAKRLWVRLKPAGGRVETDYTYNNAGDLASIGYGDGNVTPSQTFTYDRRGRLTSVLKGNNGGTTTLSYNDADQWISDTYSGGTLGGLSVEQTRDPGLRPWVVTARNVYSRVTERSY